MSGHLCSVNAHWLRKNCCDAFGSGRHSIPVWAVDLRLVGFPAASGTTVSTSNIHGGYHRVRAWLRTMHADGRHAPTVHSQYNKPRYKELFDLGNNFVGGNEHWLSTSSTNYTSIFLVVRNIRYYQHGMRLYSPFTGISRLVAASEFPLSILCKVSAVPIAGGGGARARCARQWCPGVSKQLLLIGRFCPGVCGSFALLEAGCMLPWQSNATRPDCRPSHQTLD